MDCLCQMRRDQETGFFIFNERAAILLIFGPYTTRKISGSR
jgi:hypothetical protein